MNKMFHLFSEGENVLFRDDSDYIFFNNKFASSCHAFQLQALAETTMSTHFHSFVETADESVINGFITKIKKAYAMYYFAKYGHSLGNAFRITKVEIIGTEFAKNELLYIMKNPVHHYVSYFPLAYPFSSASYLFMDSIMPKKFEEVYLKMTKQFKVLTTRRKKQISGSDKIPDDWLVSDNDMILPSSYINVTRARAFWNDNVKSFLVDMIKNQTDAKQEIISADVLDIRTSGLTDIDVCRIIDTFSIQAGHKSFHELTSEEKHKIIRILKQKAIFEAQIDRCLWK